MKWIKFTNYYPNCPCKVLFFDGNTNCVALVDVTEDFKVFSDGYYCNSKECSWSYDDCGCELEITDNSYWMYLLSIPLPSGKE
jgi:hypothetical protein